MTILWIISLLVISIIVYIVTGRLIGTKLNMIKRMVAVILSVAITSSVYWYAYLRFTNFPSTAGQEESAFFTTAVWIASMLLITMLIQLVLELFDAGHLRSNLQNEQAKQNMFVKLISRWRMQRRLASVLRIAVKHGIGQAIGFRRTSEGERSFARSFRMMLEESDGLFIKFGQMLSTRKDILSEALIEELSQLQENVKPMTNQQIETRLQAAYGKNWQQKFTKFNMEPLASGSIGQVHEALLFENHEKVVVKVLRPDITELLKNDLDILINFAAWLNEESLWAENLGFLDLATSFANNMREEINFDIELRNMEQISNALKQVDSNVQIPKVYPEVSDSTILVMDYVDGVKITEAKDVLAVRGRSQQDVLAELFTSFLHQVLVAGVFHGDPHPGNIHVLKETGQVAMLDFGAVGRIGAKEQRGLTLLFIGYHRRDPKVFIEAIRHLVEDEKHLSDKSFEQDIEQLLARLTYLDHVSTTELVQSIFTIIQNHHMKLFPMVSVAMRALIILEGTIKSVSRDFDAFAYASKFAGSQITMKNVKAKAEEFKKTLQEEVVMMLPVLRDLPRRLDHFTRNLEKGEVKVAMDFTSNTANKAFMTKWLSQFMLLLVGITFGGLSVAILAIAQFMSGTITIYLNTAAFIGLFLSLIILVRLSLQVIRESKRIQK
ncbi:ABC1 kinase family protein [Kurthia sibirica]|nr:AarF/UbiB family protein [Kurthia sibirica]